MSMNWKALLITIGIFIGIGAYIYLLCTQFFITMLITFGGILVLGIIMLMLVTYLEIAEKLKK